jgi:polygalacturonase
MTWLNIKDFGAVQGAKTSQAPAIQKALDQAEAAGGGTVVVPPGDFLAGTILMKSNVRLHLESGARILGSPRLGDYRHDIGAFVDAVDQERGCALLVALEQDRVSLTGQGTVDGQGGLFAMDEPKRPFLIRFIRSRNILVEGVTLRNSAAWVTHLLDCEGAMIRGVTIHSHVNGNNDAIDIDSSRRVIVTGCDLDTGDDAVCLKSTADSPCENVTVTGCIIKSHWGAFKIGTESRGDIRNVVFGNNIIRDTHGGGVKIISMDGANVENVLVSDVVMDRVSGPIFIRLGERKRTYLPGQKPKPAGTIRGITLRNIRGSVWEEGFDLWGHKRRAGILVTGVPGAPIRDLILDNFRLDFPGGGTLEEAKRRVPEHRDHYPEFPIFGPLPSWGFYVRDTEGAIFRDIELRLRAPDQRPPWKVERAKAIRKQNVRFVAFRRSPSRKGKQ